MDVATQEDFYELDEKLYALFDANTEKRYEKNYRISFSE